MRHSSHEATWGSTARQSGARSSRRRARFAAIGVVSLLLLALSGGGSAVGASSIDDVVRDLVP